MIKVIKDVKAMSKFTMAVSKLTLSNLSFLESLFFLPKLSPPFKFKKLSG